MPGTVKSTLELDGEAEYKQKIEQSYRALRVLRSELKAETAEMGKNATAEEKNAKKTENLKKQIKEQEKIVKQLQDALEQSKKQYADNSEVQEKWEVKLNNARTTLANMKNQLESTSSSMTAFSTAAGNMDTNTGSAVQGVVDLGDAMDSLKDIANTVSSTISSAFNGIVDNIKNTVTEVWDLISQAMSAASDYASLQGMYGGSAADIAQFYQTAGYAGTDSSTVTSMINKLIQNTHNATDESDITKLLKEWGISESDYSNHWDYFSAVFTKLLNQSGGDQNKAYEMAEKLFGGESASKVAGLISNWGHGADSYQSSIADTGMSWTDQQIEDLNNLSVKIDEIKQTWEAFQQHLGVELYYTLNAKDGADIALAALQDVAKIFFGDDATASAATKDLTLQIQAGIDWVFNGVSNLSQMLSGLEEDLKDSQDPTLQNIGDMIGTIRSLLDWAVSEKENISKALALWLKFQVMNVQVQAVTGQSIQELWNSVKDIASDIASIWGVVTLYKTGKYVANNVVGDAATGATVGATASGGSSWLSSLASTVGGTITSIGFGAAYLYGLVKAGQYGAQHPENSPENEEYVTNGVTDQSVQDAINAYDLARTQFYAAEQSYLAGELSQQEYEAAYNNMDSAGNALKALDSSAFDRYMSWAMNNQGASMGEYTDEQVNAFKEMDDTVKEAADTVESAVSTFTSSAFTLPLPDETPVAGATDLPEEETPKTEEWIPAPEDYVELEDDVPDIAESVKTIKDIITSNVVQLDKPEEDTAPLAGPTDLDDVEGSVMRTVDGATKKAESWLQSQARALADAINGAQVKIDGTTFGNLVVHYANQGIAQLM